MNYSISVFLHEDVLMISLISRWHFLLTGIPFLLTVLQQQKRSHNSFVEATRFYGSKFCMKVLCMKSKAEEMVVLIW